MNDGQRGIKVCHLITELNVGGAEKALARLVVRLDGSRFASSVACLYDGDGMVGREIRALDVPVFDAAMTAKWRLDALWRLYSTIRRERPTILHTWMYHANVVGRLLGRLAGVPIVVSSRRNENLGGAWREFVSRCTVRCSDRVIAVCEATRQVELSQGGFPADKVVTLYNGIDLPRFSRRSEDATGRARAALGVAAEALIIGWVGRLRPQKGLCILLNAVQRLRDRYSTLRVVLVGDGALDAELRFQAASLGLHDVVWFAGGRDDVPELLPAFDVFALSSLWEGMPNVVLEAMAAGLPVVATAVGGVPEVVVDGVTGLLVPPGDPPALAEAIERLLGDPELRQRMGEAGRARVEQHFSLERMVERTQALYEELLAEKGLG